MSGTVIPCGCCGDETDEAKAFVDPDLEVPVCDECKVRLRWSHAYLCHKDNGIHGPREKK